MKYDFEFEKLRENDSHSIILRKIKPYSSILEFGPATGKMTKYLKQKLKCNIDIIEYDINSGIEASFFAEEKFLGEEKGDIEKYLWYEKLKLKSYDYIIFADVLEHLRNPIKVLSLSKELLKEEGSILVSIPNISHNSVIIDLIKGDFNYRKLGILDDTHIKFFTDKSFKRELKNIDLTAVSTEGTYLKPFETEFQNSYLDLDFKLSEILKTRLEGHIYQYIYELKKEQYCIKNNIVEQIRLIPPKFEKAKLYVKEWGDNEFSEFKSLEINYGLFENELEFNLDLYENIKELRLDPTEGKSYFYDLQIFVTNKNNEKTELEFECNYSKNDMGYEFDQDPQLLMKDINMDIKKLELIIKRRKNGDLL